MEKVLFLSTCQSSGPQESFLVCIYTHTVASIHLCSLFIYSSVCSTNSLFGVQPCNPLNDSTVYFSASHKSVESAGVNGTDRSKSHSEFAVRACVILFIYNNLCVTVCIFIFLCIDTCMY